MKKYWVEMTAYVVKAFAVEIDATTEEEAREQTTKRFGSAGGFKITKVTKEFA